MSIMKRAPSTGVKYGNRISIGVNERAYATSILPWNLIGNSKGDTILIRARASASFAEKTSYDKSGDSRFHRVKQRAATTRWSREPCDLVEQFISYYLRQCGYLGAKGCVHSLKCATSLPREEKGKEVDCERGCGRKENGNRRDEEERRTRYGEGCGSGPLIISRDWPTGLTTVSTWLDEQILRCTR
ncbi:hypothetical protein ALC53_10405 [Atta colombica]|uniref:Uncharacterized protein n=1 Tax=Atta colombica TaxID=520822 RepID=A0A195B4Y1_9HYME|nr:hypothetical protein ALC53_10405 [Atta colombica]